MTWDRCLLYRWLVGGRVRIASHEGQWLRLQVGQRVIINDMLLVVVSREVISRGGAAETGESGIRYGLKDLLAESSDEWVLPDPPFMLDDIGIVKCEACDGLYSVDCFCENA
ncbi:MAG: hypothetical protein ACO1RT_16385 [Planctomycetaceae bacterium]